MDRRDLLAGAGLLAVAGAARVAMAADDPHAHHHHAGGGKYAELVKTNADCDTKGQICLAHCIKLLGDGDKEMAACAASVRELLATCGALLTMATAESKFTPQLAAVALKVCENCEKECRKHEKKHQQCKDCGDACAACAKECKKVI